MKKHILITLSFLFTISSISCKKESKSEEKSISVSEEITSETEIDTINWYTDLCEMNSKFDASKYSKKQLKDTHHLWFGTIGYINFDGYPVFNLDDKTESIEVLEERYTEGKAELENLEVVDLPYWNNLKQLKLLELKSFYEHEKTAYFAYANPKNLVKTVYDVKAKVYVDALVSGDSLKMIAAWKKLNEEQKANNGSPEHVEKKFQSRLNSPQCLEYAKMDLFTFGWNNNTKKNCKGCEVLENRDPMYEEYKKLFISTTEECSEP
ncbi:hypothetical protein [Flavobacterium sp.]|uniref:hypothetical protein n=1 Tax=Flavobacterium sp. TaxID=239 RepID=UPI00261A493E|nr:hypothetical protein [Flavobacterium sp.]